MKIKMTKSAEWGGNRHKSGSIADAPDLVACKLIARGYAVEHVKTVEKEVEADATAVRK
jgi:hypothetical protein